MNTSKIILTSLLISFLILSNSLSQNIPLEIGVTTQATQPKSSTLRFEIYFPEPCEFNIEITGWQNTLNWGTDYDRVYVYNSGGEVIGRNAQSYESDKFLFHMLSNPDNLISRVGMAGTYFIDFHSGNDWGWPSGKDNQSYSLLVTVISVPDTNETNDDMQSAKAISVGQIINAYQWERVATNSVSGDEDWYKINLASPGKLSLMLNNWLGTFNWGIDYDRFYIYNNLGEAIGSKSSNENDPYYDWMMSPENEEININVASAGWYYLRFHSGAGYSTEGYTLTSTFTEVSDEFEPNDDMTTAKTIEFGTWYNACQWRSLDATTHVWGDEEYFHLVIPTDGELVITMNDWIGTYNWGADYDRMYIYDINGTAVGASGNDPYIDWMMGGGNTKKINLSAGEYYVRLHSGAGYSTEPYKILFEFNSSATDIDEINDSRIPSEYSLYQNYPNPFNPSTIIKYSIKEEGEVKINLYDVIGNKIYELINEIKYPGYYELKFNGNDLSSGLYIYSIQVNNFFDAKKMILIK